MTFQQMKQHVQAFKARREWLLEQYHHGLICEQDLVLALQCSPAQIAVLKTRASLDLISAKNAQDEYDFACFWASNPNAGKLADVSEF